MTASEHTELLPRVLAWTDKDPPGEKISSYTHVYADLAPFRFVIEWKGWKEPADSRTLVVQWLDGGGQLFLGGHYSTTDAAQAAAEQWLASLPRPYGAEQVPVAWQHRGPRGGWITTDEKTKWSERPLFASPTGMGVTEEQVERALRARVPGGSEVWHWIDGGGFDISGGQRDVMRIALEAALHPTSETTEVGNG